VEVLVHDHQQVVTEERDLASAPVHHLAHDLLHALRHGAQVEEIDEDKRLLTTFLVL
jgi:FMN-dependent NADH-azoreductase